MSASARRSAGIIGGLVGLALSASLAMPARSDELPALTPGTLPMAIRDGRIAELTVHLVPFDILADQPNSATAAALGRLVASVATDCFLTAQAIGHVRPGIPGDGETLAAHRLARARSEAVQATLVRGGLPAGSVASVWDYQFIVREPRVTLWIFRLPAGDECSGAPLPGAAQLAAVESPQAPSAPVVVTETDLEPAPGIHLAQVPTPEPVPAPVRGARPALLEQAGTAAVEPPAEARESVTPPTPPADLSARLALAAEPGAAVAAAASPSFTAPVARAEIVFDENSSFFPRGAEAELRQLVSALQSGHGYEFEVQAAVDDKAGRKDDPAKAVAYNRWLADRRQRRVADWLEQNAEIRVLEVRRSLLDHDPSRRVVIQARPLP